MRKYHCTRRHERRQCFQVEAHNPGQTYRRTVTEQASTDDYYSIRISQEQPADRLSITTRKIKQVKQMRRFVSGYRTRYLPRATEIVASSLTTKPTVLALLSVSRGEHLRRRFGRPRRAVRIEVAKDPFHEFTESLWGRKNMGDGGLLRLTVKCSGQFHFKKSKHPFHKFTVACRNRFF
jgi:hypothetical protein